MRSHLFRSVLLTAVLLAAGGPHRLAAQTAPRTRLAVAMLWFENRTGDPKATFWRYAPPGILGKRLHEVKAIRLLPEEAAKFAARQLNLKPGAALDAAQARKIGERIEAQRVVWGDYGREGDRWVVHAHVLNVATGKASTDPTVASPDWLVLCDDLVKQILAALSITPSDSERAKMGKPITRSAAALEAFGRGYALMQENGSYPEAEQLLRAALQADPEYIGAYVGLAATLGSQGKAAEAEKDARDGLKRASDDAGLHSVLGTCLLFQGKYAEAEAALKEAQRLDPDDADTAIRLGEVYGVQQKLDEAIAQFQDAVRLSPMRSDAYASLGFTYTLKHDRKRALGALRQAEQIDPEDINAEQLLCQSYDTLGDTALAVDHCQRFVTLARKAGANPKAVDEIEQRERYLKDTLTPSFVTALLPKVYTDQELEAALERRLTPAERKKVIYPLADTPAMRQWARELTRGAHTDQEKAHALFDGLTHRIETRQRPTTRTAREVFAAWKKPQEEFDCQEYAKLFNALARSAGLQAYYVHVEKDYHGDPVHHACASVFVGGKALLIDPTYRWFGVPHKSYHVLDDLQTIAHQMVQTGDGTERVALGCIAVKLCPEYAYAHVALANAFYHIERMDEASRHLDIADRLDPGRWDTLEGRGMIAFAQSDFATAVRYLRKALQIRPQDADAHYYLAYVLQNQDKQKEAREEFRLALQNDLETEKADDARRKIAQINEKLGAE